MLTVADTCVRQSWSRPQRRERRKMTTIYEEVGRTVRLALLSWPRTIRLCLILAVCAAVLICWYIYVW